LVGVVELGPVRVLVAVMLGDRELAREHVDNVHIRVAVVV
jgi:hypothetical protein